MFGFVQSFGKCVSEYGGGGAAAERQRPTLDILINYHRRHRESIFFLLLHSVYIGHCRRRRRRLQANGQFSVFVRLTSAVNHCCRCYCCCCRRHHHHPQSLIDELCIEESLNCVRSHVKTAATFVNNTNQEDKQHKKNNKIK